MFGGELVGALIPIWSNTKRVGKSVFTYSLSRTLRKMIDKNIKILVVCINMDYGNLTQLFNIEKTKISLENIVNSINHIDLDYTKLLDRTADDIYIIDSKYTNALFAQKNIREFELLFEDFKKKFDLILVDTLSGNHHVLTNMIIKKSDFVLNILTQDIDSLESQNFLNENDLFYLINFYKEIYPSAKDICSLYNINKEQVFKLPACEDLQEMKNKKELNHYLLHDTEYNLITRKIALKLIEKLNLKLTDEEIKKINESNQKKNIFDFIKNLRGANNE